MNAKKAKALRRELLLFNEKRKLNPADATVELALKIRGTATDRQIRRAHRFIMKALLLPTDYSFTETPKKEPVKL